MLQQTFALFAAFENICCKKTTSGVEVFLKTRKSPQLG